MQALKRVCVRKHCSESPDNVSHTYSVQRERLEVPVQILNKMEDYTMAFLFWHLSMLTSFPALGEHSKMQVHSLQILEYIPVQDYNSLKERTRAETIV